jgi:hypothetical protein
MPANKDFKRLVRGRMQKTGEAYTTAHAHLLRQKPPTTTSSSRRPAPSEYAGIAGRSDAILKERTGCTWERWVKALDRAKAYTWPHGKIAKYVQDRYKTNGWWAQTVTVGYERIKGLRAVGQRRDGSYEANKSKTFAASLERLYRAFSDKRTRERWLPGVDLKIRTATRGKSMRITWPDQTSLVVGFLRTGTGKSQVAVQHGKLPNRDSAARMKQYWADRLSALEDVLATR